MRHNTGGSPAPTLTYHLTTPLTPGNDFSACFRSFGQQFWSICSTARLRIIELSLFFSIASLKEDSFATNIYFAQKKSVYFIYLWIQPIMQKMGGKWFLSTCNFHFGTEKPMQKTSLNSISYFHLVLATASMAKVHANRLPSLWLQ